MALGLYDCARQNGVRFDWLAFDRGYGSKPLYLQRPSDHEHPFVNEVPTTFSCWLGAPPVTNRPYRHSGGGRPKKPLRLRSDVTRQRAGADEVRPRAARPGPKQFQRECVGRVENFHAAGQAVQLAAGIVRQANSESKCCTLVVTIRGASQSSAARRLRRDFLDGSRLDWCSMTTPSPR
ncbi:hypothetical protein Pla175_19560 [Pirellulimonas nuda]|uniref:Transposase IS701-like DDE domain-containing protein n=1 Tax=Pirellulimonas nuda TaxID=2528009 RepID=A0A518DAR1_9BACT|nr:hypothetical protein Pla175_19560 [Pirellulimonas nuda]